MGKFRSPSEAKRIRYWSGFGYFSPDLEKIKQLLVRSEHQNTCEDTGNVVKYLAKSSKKKDLRQWKEIESSTPFVVKAATSLFLKVGKCAYRCYTPAGITWICTQNWLEKFSFHPISEWWCSITCLCQERNCLHFLLKILLSYETSIYRIEC